MSDLTEVVGKYSAIIDLQKEVIDELFSLLGQHIAADELDALPCVGKINQAAGIRATIERR